MSVTKIFSDLIINAWGWHITSDIPKEIKKAVVIVAPHTSYCDFLLGRISFWHMNVETKFLIKKEAFFWPFGLLLRKLGGLPVNRKKAGRLTDAIARMYDDHESLFITITPEGTRTLVQKWKLGFYYIAVTANVPIILGVLDYENKRGGMKKVFYPTGDMKEDLKEIKRFYEGVNGKNPERSKIFY